MQVQILFFGALKELAGGASRKMELPDGATVGDFVRLITKEVPSIEGYAGSMAVAVNQEYARCESVLHDQDEIGLLPPVSGGSGPAPSGSGRLAFLVRERIDSSKVVETMKNPSDGAVVVFDGIVRDNTRGRRTIYLEYEAYEDMAIKQIEALVHSAKTQYGVREGVIVHRLGRLYVGETSVLIVVASAHRAAAFDACRWMIDELKKSVPIWKKEFFEDGAVWADGEPFPSNLIAHRQAERGDH